MIAALSGILTALFDALAWPFGDHRGAALAAVSFVVGAVLIGLFRLASDPQRIQRARDRVAARILEIRLYADDPVLVMRALGGVLSANLGYLRAALRPILVLAVVAGLAWIQLEARYAVRPLRPGDEVVVTAHLRPGLDPRRLAVHAEAEGPLAIAAGPVRVPAERAVVWRVRLASVPSPHTVAGDAPRAASDAPEPALRLEALEQTWRVPIVVRARHRVVARHRDATSPIDAFVHPGLAPPPRSHPVAGIDVAYPDTRYDFAGHRLHWIVVFLVGTTVGALIPKFVFRITI